tara:strand:- start:16295 stop:17179 length:885 start_codon:yes stop_codon:yes gene_type:complete
MLKIIQSRIVIFLVSIGLSYLLPVIYQDILGFLLILTIGLIHGANDLLIIKKYAKNDGLKSQFSYFLLYLFIVFLGFAFFYLFPSIALLSFVLVSIYHFGEQHWEAYALNAFPVEIKKIYPIVLHGLIFFVIVFMNNINIVNNVLINFDSLSLDYTFLQVSFFSLSIIYMFILFSSKSFRGFLIDEFVFFMLFYLLTLNSSLIYGFSIYFIFFHSILSIKDQVKFIYDDNSSQYIRKYLINALPYFTLAVMFLLAFYLIIDFESLNILPILFTFLAAITFPHVLVIEKMYSSMK